MVKTGGASNLKPKISRCRSGGVCSVQSMDRFQKPVGFSIDHDGYNYGTGWGVCFTLLVFVVGVVYSIEKLVIQEQKESYSVTHIQDLEGTFGRSNGLNIAFAFNEYGAADMTIPIESEQTFELEAEIYGWYTEKNKLTTSRKYIKLRTHRCTREELGFEPQGGS